MSRKLFCLIFIGLILGSSPVMANDPSKMKTAVDSAEKWIGLVDEGKYTESWQELSESIRQAIGQEQWEEAVKTVRKPLGNLVTRKLKSAEYTTTMPGAPDGEYVVIQFSTSFENKKSGVETITPKMDADGNWRVSGYYIK